jgi:protein SCO1
MTKKDPASPPIWVLVLCAAILIAAPIALYQFLSDPGGDDFFGQKINPSQEAYDFSLTDHHAKPFRLSDLKGKAVLLAFGFTHCPDICPTTLNSLAGIYEALPEPDRKKLQVVFVSVDPGRDTPEQLAKYVPFFNDSFLGVTGDEEAIKKTAKEYGVFYEYAPLVSNNTATSYTVNHSSYVYLIDPSGRFTMLFDYDKLPESQRIANDIETILKAGTGG